MGKKIIFGIIIWAACLTTFVATAPNKKPILAVFAEDEQLWAMQCPVPPKDRVPNKSGVQCVWASLEMLGRWAECSKMVDPPLTGRSECQKESGPQLVATMLKKIDVKFVQAMPGKDKSASRELMVNSLAQGKPCLFGIPGHAMVVVHYDPVMVGWVDNSDRQLKLKTGTTEKFENMWDGWVLSLEEGEETIRNKTKICPTQATSWGKMKYFSRHDVLEISRLNLTGYDPNQ